MLSKEYGHVNMILLICDKYDDNSIKNMFNTVYLEDEKDKLSFYMALFYDFCNCNRNQVKDLTIKIYLLKTKDLYAETELKNQLRCKVEIEVIPCIKY